MMRLNVALWVALALALAIGSCRGPGATNAPSSPTTLAAPAAPATDEALVPLLDGMWERHVEVLRELRSRRPWLRGSTHVHTLYSGDSRTRPEKVVAWYEEHGYDFIVITDHNRVTDGISADLRSKSGLLVLKGTELTNNPPSCEPAPPLAKGKCRIHVNSLFVTDYPATEKGVRPERMDWREKKSIARVDLYQAALTKTAKLGGLAQLNHPTWHWGTDGKLATELARRGMRFIEIANVAFERWNGGDDTYPGTEAIWDAALTAGHRMWGVASDDAHHYYDIADVRARGGALYPAGRGFVMVRAERDPRSIRDAMERGDFYASTGILFRRLERIGNELIIEVEPTERRGITIELIGSGGALIKRAPGNNLRFPLDRTIGYIRARVTAADGARAWTQPFFLD